MPESWDPEIYQQRAKAWRDRAATLPPGREHDACVVLAEGYARLAGLIEGSQAPGSTTAIRPGMTPGAEADIHQSR
jgi:hypothetical protein